MSTIVPTATPYRSPAGATIARGDTEVQSRCLTPLQPPRSRRTTVARIVEKGAPVYGINTGFGKLASVRIDAADLGALQRNLVLSHAAGRRRAHATASCA